ncbi:MAG: sulfur carrier protein ThiS [Peptococcaceae bacterium]|nr:sulfur carrier protein ThiS [Peptococcaceae bacterium]
MRIVLNGKDEELAEGLTVARLISDKSINPANIIVEHNYNIVKNEDWQNVVLKDNDNLEILRLVGGG